MKRKKITCFILTLLILLQLILSSCSDKNVKEDDNDLEKTDVSLDKNENISAAWNTDLSEYKVDIPYELPVFTSDAGNYDVNMDLSDLFNAGQYVGFTKNQIKSIYEDGFVALKPNNSALQLHHIYEFPMYKESPVFITTDSALYLYHIFYNNSLTYVELSSLYDKLSNLSKHMLKNSLEYYNNSDYDKVKGEFKFITSFFLTGCKLMDVDLSGIDIPEDLSNLADKEVQLINDASDFEKSPIMGEDIDYSQYTVRGHYTGSEKLGKYFKTMMLYGLEGFPVFKENTKKPELDIDNLIKGMIITCLTLNDEEAFTEYENIYSTTALYVGLSDDLGIFEYRDLIEKVYGQNPDINIFKDDSLYDKLLDEALQLPEPKIQAKYTSVSTPVGRQFRFMGQRYSFDAEVLQNLIEPIQRPVPSGLDVIASFGNARAEDLLDTYYRPKEMWSDYEKNLDKMRENEKSITDNEWKSDLYNGWLWSIKSSSASFEDKEGMPKFMKSKKWTDKNIHTALGSYAELKHDSILYKKQSGAEMGAGPEVSIPYNYVEPNVEVYAKLKWLAKNTKENLKLRNMLDESTESILDDIIEMESTLMNVSVKELMNQNITEKENDMLYSYGGEIDYIYKDLNYMLMDEGINDSDNFTSALIADISTIAPNSFSSKGQYLEIGNGLPCEIYVVCRTNGKTYLARGALFNYYEFLSDKRLTDRQWFSLLGIKQMAMVYDEEKGEYTPIEKYDENGALVLDKNTQYDYETTELGEPSPNLVPKPEWTRSFISDEANNVTITDNMNLDWNK